MRNGSSGLTKERKKAYSEVAKINGKNEASIGEIRYFERERDSIIVLFYYLLLLLISSCG